MVARTPSIIHLRRPREFSGASLHKSRFSGGDSYAGHAARVVGVEDVVKGCCPKRHPPDGVAVDYTDDDEGVVGEFGGQVIPAYRRDPEDAELLRLVEAVSRGSGG